MGGFIGTALQHGRTLQQASLSLDFDELPEDFFEKCVPASSTFIPLTDSSSTVENSFNYFIPQTTNYNIPSTSSNIPNDFYPPQTSLPTASSSSDLEFFNMNSDVYNEQYPSVPNVSPPDIQFSNNQQSPSLPKPRRSCKRQSSSVSTDSSNDYRSMRDKNNIASQRSRQKRQAKIRETREEKRRLETQKVELEAQIVALETQVEDYKRMVMMFAKNKK